MVGKTLGHYEILEPLGAGGMGEVYRARDTSLRRDVAIKVLPEEFTTDADRLARLEREAHLLASLNHPNIATIHSLEEAEDVRFLVLELVKGESLEERLSRGPMPVEKALDVCKQIAEALEAAHGEGIIHRDLKPANILITPDGKAKVLDFGLAKTVEVAPPEADMSHSPTVTVAGTQAGVILGTAPYMSPEQVRGKPLDRRADNWAFGCVLYEMLTGSRTFARETVADTLAAIIEAEPEWNRLPGNTPVAIRALLRRCLRKELKLRLRDIGDAWIEITEAMGESPAAAEASAVVPGQRRWKRAVPLPVAVGITVAVTTLVVWGLMSATPPPPEVPLRLEVKVTDSAIHMDSGPAVVLSPDGTRLAYVVGDPLGWSELHLRSLETLQDTTLVTGRPRGPFFSPDGQWVGFGTVTELKRVPLAGGTPVTAAPSFARGGASWGPDGEVIYGLQTVGLIRVPREGGDPQQLTTLDAERGEVTHRRPHILPGGKAVLFTSHTQNAEFDAANIEVLDLATTERKLLLRGGYDARYAPTGHLVYASRGALHAVAFDLQDLEVVGSPVAILQGVSMRPEAGFAHFSFADTGTLAYVSSEATVQRYPIVRVDRQGNASSLWEQPGRYIGPRLSPDGTRLAVSALADDSGLDLWIYDMERGVPTQLTFHEGYEIFPTWSPDSQRLAWGASLNGGSMDVYVGRADGSGVPQRLTESPNILVPASWSADGTLLTLVELVLGGDRVNMDLWVLPLEGDWEPQAFLITDAVETHPVFSPNGRWIAYSSDESGDFEVYVRPYPVEPGRSRLSFDGGSQPRWSRDGGELFYRTDDGVMVVAVETESETFVHGRPRELMRGSFLGGRRGMNLAGTVALSDYDVAPDGQSFVMFPGISTGIANNNVTLVLNWFEELKQRVPTGRQ